MIKKTEDQWYVRQGEQALGPYPEEQIGRYLILGRIDLDTMVSHDKLNWFELKTIPELVPAVVSEAGTPEGDRALMLARIREDERSSRSESEAGFGDRRGEEGELFHLHRQVLDDALTRQMQSFSWLLIFAVMVMIIVIALLGVYFIY